MELKDGQTIFSNAPVAGLFKKLLKTQNCSQSQNH